MHLAPGARLRTLLVWTPVAAAIVVGVMLAASAASPQVRGLPPGTGAFHWSQSRTR